MIPEKLEYCPLCSSGHFIFKADIKDHALTKETFTLHECQNCSLVFTNSRPNFESSIKYYNFSTYTSHQNNSKRIIDIIYNFIRGKTLQSKLTLINKLVTQKGRILDYGTGTGHFPKLTSANGWKTEAVEPNPNALKNSVFSNTKKDLLDLINKEKFNVITLFHVLEHVHQLKETLNQLTSLIEKDGFLILALPNHESYDAKIYNEFWAAFDVPRHLYHFNQKAVAHISKIYNLEIKEKIPMKYDSYYVSLLSEKYKNPNQTALIKWIKSIKNGYISNQKANKNISNSSSILYILKKK